jgi:outer membrane lipoprotein-sorting protein
MVQGNIIMMKKIVGAWVLFLAAHGAAWAGPDARAILAACDQVRSPNASFSLKAKLVEYRNGKQVDASALVVYAKPDLSSGQFDNLVMFLSPERDAGKLLLKNDNDLWLYDPANKASIRISPKERLLGQASNGDVVTVNWSKDYESSIVGEEALADGDRQPTKAHHLSLTAKTAQITYARIELWVEVDSNRPLKAQFYSESNRLLKTAYYRRYQPELGAMRPTETVIIDGLDPKWVTVMRYSDYVTKAIPDAWLQRDYLPTFRPD